MLGSDYPFPLGEHLPGKLVEDMADFDDKLKVLGNYELNSKALYCSTA